MNHRNDRQHDCALVWFRRDLRLTDHPALAAALAAARTVVPVFVADAADTAGAASRSWLHHSLERLDAALRARGSPLVIRIGPSSDALRRLAAETGAGAVFWNRLHEPAAVAQQRALAAALAARGIEAQCRDDAPWHAPEALTTRSGQPYRVFTPFWRALRAARAEPPVTPAPRRLPGPAHPPASAALADLDLLPQPRWDRQFYADGVPGEEGALQRLAAFVDGELAGYRTQREMPAGGSSRLSPHLHFGEISARQILAALRRAQAEQRAPEDDIAAFERQLGWRDFAHYLLEHFPDTPTQPLNPAFGQFPWRAAADYAGDLQAWQRGQTGIPLVDAGMRELWASGWMHNRVRMVVASFLTKHLLIPWQEGARWFWDTLVDADLANNTLGWQWVAGCGADAAPYFRVFNPVLQSQRFDPRGIYLRRWLPELARLPDRAIHAPWQAPPRQLAAAGLRLGRDYPHPIVDLAAGRQRALAAYAAMRAR